MKYILLGFSILCFSCHSGKPEKDDMNSNTVDISMDTWILGNEALKSLLSAYIVQAKDELKNGNFVVIYYKAINDSTCRYVFCVSFDINTFIDDFSPLVLFKFEQHLISFHVKGLYIFKMNDDFLVEFMKKNFPKQYNYYLRDGDYPIGATGGGLTWELVFQNDSFISKEEYYTQ